MTRKIRYIKAYFIFIIKKIIIKLFSIVHKKRYQEILNSIDAISLTDFHFNEKKFHNSFHH